MRCDESNSFDVGRLKQCAQFTGDPERTAGTICFHEETRAFYLTGKSMTYAFKIDQNGWIEHLYWGERVASDDDLTYLCAANINLPFDPKPVQSNIDDVMRQ